ncbi:hypothetical protein [Pseudomonas sp. KK4]|uniref:hypothetical protein n=1 Tax=Pseudomonas sp. KK4 TaxID=1855729 RepID=UPI0011155AA7|nr:hypothetical protein [Pseudomonas sp. KK4]
MTDDHTPDFSKVPTGMLPFPPVEAVFVGRSTGAGQRSAPFVQLGYQHRKPGRRRHDRHVHAPIEGLVLFTFDYS